MATDLLMIGMAQVLAAFVETLRDPLDALSLLAVLAMLNQLQLYMRTDLYLVATTLARTKNLYQDASVYLLDRLRRLAGRNHGPDPMAALSTRELTMARGYAVLMVAGSAMAIGIFVMVAVPTLVAMVSRAVASVRAGGWLGAVDGTLTLAVMACVLIVFVVALLRGRGERIRRLRERLR